MKQHSSIETISYKHMKSGTKILQINFRHFQVVLMKDRHKHTENENYPTAIIESATEIWCFGFFPHEIQSTQWAVSLMFNMMRCTTP